MWNTENRSDLQVEPKNRSDMWTKSSKQIWSAKKTVKGDMIYTLNLDLNQGIWIAKNMGYN